MWGKKKEYGMKGLRKKLKAKDEPQLRGREQGVPVVLEISIRRVERPSKLSYL